MAKPFPPLSCPKNILLATDLGPRSDRALDRAFHLAGQWKAHLTIAHSIEVEFEPYHKDVPSWRQKADRSAILKQRLLDTFRLEKRPEADIVIEKGRPDTVILDLAKAKEIDLIVTGIAHAEPLGRKVLGNTVGTLVRKAGCSVLTVKKRLPQGYRHIAVGIDMSDFSKKALLHALECFPHVRKITAIHAVSLPFRGLADNPDQYARSLRDDVRARCQGYLSGILPAGAQVDLVVDEGSPGRLIADYADDMDVDLVIAGTHGAGGLLDALLGTAAIDIQETVCCDVLIVR